MSSLFHDRRGLFAIALGGALVFTMLACASAEVDAQVPADVPKPAAAEAQAALPTPLSQARALLAAENYTDAEQLLRELIQQQPGSPERHFLLAFALLHEQRPKDALDEYAKGAKLREWGPEEFVGVGSAQLVLKNYAEAETALAASAKLAPLKPLTWYLLGRAQYLQNHAADAEKSLRTCLQLNWQNLRAEYTLGLVYEALGRPESAAAAYRAAIALQEPPLAPPSTAPATGMVETTSLPAASPSTKKTAKEPGPYLSLGMLLRRQGKAAEALPLLTKAAAMAPRDSITHEELAVAQEQLGQFDQALAEMRTAAELSPNLPEIHFYLGRLYRITGHPEQATAEFALTAGLTRTQQAVNASGHPAQ